MTRLAQQHAEVVGVIEIPREPGQMRDAIDFTHPTRRRGVLAGAAQWLGTGAPRLLADEALLASLEDRAAWVGPAAIWLVQGLEVSGADLEVDEARVLGRFLSRNQHRLIIELRLLEQIVEPLKRLLGAFETGSREWAWRRDQEASGRLYRVLGHALYNRGFQFYDDAIKAFGASDAAFMALAPSDEMANQRAHVLDHIALASGRRWPDSPYDLPTILELFAKAQGLARDDWRRSEIEAHQGSTYGRYLEWSRAATHFDASIMIRRTLLETGHEQYATHESISRNVVLLDQANGLANLVLSRAMEALMHGALGAGWLGRRPAFEQYLQDARAHMNEVAASLQKRHDFDVAIGFAETAIALAEGDVDRAETAITMSREAVGAVDLRGYPAARYAHARGLIRLARGQWEDALSYFSDAEAYYGPSTADIMPIRVWRAGALARLGRADEAQEFLRAPRAYYQALKASGLGMGAAWVESEIRRAR